MAFHHKPTNLPQARDRYLKAKERLLRRALHYGLLEHVALARASLAEIEAAVTFYMLNYQPAKDRQPDGEMRLKNPCVDLARRGVVKQLGVVSEEDAAKITELTLCLDTHFLCYGVYGKDGGRNDPAVELVKLCKDNVDVAIELSELHRDYIVAMLDVNTVARGSNANVVSWGGHAEAYAKNQLNFDYVDYLGHVMHPEAILAVGPDLKARIENGKTIVCACLRREVYVSACATFENILRVHGHDVRVTFFVDLYEGNRDVLDVLRKVKSDDAIAYWYGESTCPAARKAHKDAIQALHLAAMSSDARARYEASLFKPGPANPSYGKAPASAFQPGHVPSDETKAAMSKSKLGNTNNTRPTTVRFECPVPGCTFDTSRPDMTMKHHLSGRSKPTSHDSPYCQACGDVVIGLIAAGDTDSLAGNLSKWKRWTGLI